MTIAITVLVLSVFGFMVGALLAKLSQSSGKILPETRDTGPGATKHDHTESVQVLDLVDEVNRMLPQTQCAQCGYPGCRPYAQAIVEDDAAINLCPPGGDALIQDLAHYLGKTVIPLNEEAGTTKPPQVAVIDEPTCIGCTLCIAACPVDAIVGSNKLMHTVIESHCTGCELCLPPCPVDCIELVEKPATLASWRWPEP